MAGSRGKGAIALPSEDGGMALAVVDALDCAGGGVGVAVVWAVKAVAWVGRVVVRARVVVVHSLAHSCWHSHSARTH